LAAAAAALASALATSAWASSHGRFPDGRYTTSQLVSPGTMIAEMTIWMNAANNAGTGDSVKYFSVGDRDKLASALRAWPKAIVVDNLYMICYSAADRATHFGPLAARWQFPRDFPRCMREAQARGLTATTPRSVPALTQLYGTAGADPQYDKFVILAEPPGTNTFWRTTAFHEAIHVYFAHSSFWDPRSRIGGWTGAGADDDMSGNAPETISAEAQFWGDVRALRRDMDPTMERMSQAMRGGTLPIGDLENAVTWLASLRNRMANWHENVAYVLKQIGGKNDIDGLEGAYRARLHKGLADLIKKAEEEADKCNLAAARRLIRDFRTLPPAGSRIRGAARQGWHDWLQAEARPFAALDRKLATAEAEMQPARDLDESTVAAAEKAVGDAETAVEDADRKVYGLKQLVLNQCPAVRSWAEGIGKAIETANEQENEARESFAESERRTENVCRLRDSLNRVRDAGDWSGSYLREQVRFATDAAKRAHEPMEATEQAAQAADAAAREAAELARKIGEQERDFETARKPARPALDKAKPKAEAALRAVENARRTLTAYVGGRATPIDPDATVVPASTFTQRCGKSTDAEAFLTRLEAAEKKAKAALAKVKAMEGDLEALDEAAANPCDRGDFEDPALAGAAATRAAGFAKSAREAWVKRGEICAAEIRRYALGRIEVGAVKKGKRKTP